MSGNDTTEAQRLRVSYAAALRAEAERRFGVARAAALAAAIEDVASWMAEVSAFPLDPDEAPAFYAEPPS